MKNFKSSIKTITIVSIACASLGMVILSANNMSYSSACYAHSVELNVTYDDCEETPYVDSDDIGDGENEKWYAFFIQW